MTMYLLFETRSHARRSTCDQWPYGYQRMISRRVHPGTIMILSSSSLSSSAPARRGLFIVLAFSAGNKNVIPTKPTTFPRAVSWPYNNIAGICFSLIPRPTRDWHSIAPIVVRRKNGYRILLLFYYHERSSRPPVHALTRTRDDVHEEQLYGPFVVEYGVHNITKIETFVHRRKTS